MAVRNDLGKEFLKGEALKERANSLAVYVTDERDVGRVRLDVRTKAGRDDAQDWVKLRADATKQGFFVAWNLEALSGAGKISSRDEILDVTVIVASSDILELVRCCRSLTILRGETIEDAEVVASTKLSARYIVNGFLLVPMKFTRSKKGRIFATLQFKNSPAELELAYPVVVWKNLKLLQNVGLNNYGNDVDLVRAKSVDSTRFQGVITMARRTDFSVDVSGWVRDNLRPGVPVRLSLMIGDKSTQPFLARNELPAAERTNVPDGAYSFKLRSVLSPDEMDAKLFIRFTDADELLEVVPTLVRPVLDAEVVDSEELCDDDEVIGNVETITTEVIRGWALCLAKPNSTIGLYLYVNGRVFSYTRCNNYRQDVATKYGGHGYHGFEFELPPNLSSGDAVTIRIEPAAGRGNIRKSVGKIDVGWSHFYSALLTTDHSFDEVEINGAGTEVSIIILNLNGAALLFDLFNSAEKFESRNSIEWIVVDHGSTDDTEEICSQAALRGHKIQYHPRGRNYSFSQSNNYGAQFASFENLIFANNDLVFTSPILSKVVSCLEDDRVGVVGIGLTDYVEERPDSQTAPVQHMGVYITPKMMGNWFRPFEARLAPENESGLNRIVAVPAVTGAFLAIRRADFLQVGGFSNAYSYGLEDVDLCLRIQYQLAKEIVCRNDVTISHHRGFSRKKDKHSGLLRRENNRYFTSTWSQFLRSSIKRDVLFRASFWTGSRPVVAFAVTDAGDNTSAGEYYTASELGKALQKILPIHTRYLVESDWYDLTGVDVLVVMVNRYDLGKVRAVNPFLVTINWTRQWFDRWSEDKTIYSYDYVWASSQRAAKYITDRTGLKVDVVQIASDFTSFSSGTARDEYRCDYCFTGSKFGISREIEYDLDPASISGAGKVFGYNWEGTAFEPISQGPVAYSKLPDVYASTKIVLDDANVATKPWGSCNSRVFDSLAAGCLLISNGDLGVTELFGDKVPTFSDKASLTSVLNYWISNDLEREKRIEELQEIVKERHTYDVRAATVLSLLSQSPIRRRIAIKCAAKRNEEAQWGDYHYGNSLASALRRLGYTVRLDVRENWYSAISELDDIVIVLRGLIAYEPRIHQINLMWLISHPTDVAVSELNKYDHVFVASNLFANHLRELCSAPLEFLPQCTDTARFFFDETHAASHRERSVFVGNSRGVFRDAVRWALSGEIPLDVYGTGWEPFIPERDIKGRLVPNEVLGSVYAQARYVLCDHWPDMRELGFISNRVFDVLAVGGNLVVDRVRGLEDLFSSGVALFDSEASLAHILNADITRSFEEVRDLACYVAQAHSFDARARRICDVIDVMVGQSGDKL